MRKGSVFGKPLCRRRRRPPSSVREARGKFLGFLGESRLNSVKLSLI